MNKLQRFIIRVLDAVPRNEYNELLHQYIDKTDEHFRHTRLCSSAYEGNTRLISELARKNQDLTNDNKMLCLRVAYTEMSRPGVPIKKEIQGDFKNGNAIVG